MRDGDGITAPEPLAGWYSPLPGLDAPISLVDTESLDAWVTSVPRGRGASRLNLLSATVCVDLAEAMLRSDRPPLTAGENSRIYIVCPYRAHARLLQLLVEARGLTGDIRTGTAHHFQGGEAPVVIFDLVNDEPHWKVGLFIPDGDETTMRLMNVAITKAMRRLVVVGDFSWQDKLARNGPFMERLLDALRTRGAMRDVKEVIEPGIAGRAGAVAPSVVASPPPSEDHLVVPQDDFYPALATDLSAVADRIVIFPPLMSTERLSIIEPALRRISCLSSRSRSAP